MELSCIREQAHLSGILADKDEAVLRVRCLFVSLVGRNIDGLRIAESIHEEDDVRLLDLLLLVDRFLGVFNCCPALAPVFLFEAVKLVHDNLCHGIPALKDVLIAVDISHGLFVLIDQRLDLESDQLIQTHVQNGVRLLLREHELCCHDL